MTCSFCVLTLSQTMMPKFSISFLLAAIAVIVTMSAACAEVYRYVDENGRVVYSSERPMQDIAAKKVVIRDNSVSSNIDVNAPAARADRDVVIYTASWCGVCKTAKAYFNEKDIAFEEFDIERDPRGKSDFRRLGGRAVPVILVGEQRMNGFDVASFERLYRAE